MFSNYSDNDEEINISNNRLTILPDLTKFGNLKTFNCNHNQLSHLLPLPSTLQKLYCSINQLSRLPPLPSTLQELHCSNNRLSYLPPLPSTLKILYLFHNQLTSLPPLPSTLQILDCSCNQLISLPSLPSTLQILDCYNNSFSLPLKTIEQWKFYSGFSQLKTSYQNDLAKKIQRKWRTYWDEPYRIQQWEDGTTSPICRCQENYFKEFNENFL